MHTAFLNQKITTHFPMTNAVKKMQQNLNERLHIKQNTF